MFAIHYITSSIFCVPPDSKNTQVLLLLKCLRCFSPFANGRRLLKLKTTTTAAAAAVISTTTKEEKIEKVKEEDDDDEDQLAVVHGLRFLTLLIIIVGHALDWNGLNMFSKCLPMLGK